MPWPPDEPPWTDAEVRGARMRPEHERTPLPSVGEQVLFRAREWEDPVPATITWVQDTSTPLCSNGTDAYPADVYVWEHPGGAHPRTWTHPRVRFELRLTPDPWPRVGLLLEDGNEAASRESRVRGAPGWLRPGEGR